MAMPHLESYFKRGILLSASPTNRNIRLLLYSRQMYKQDRCFLIVDRRAEHPVKLNRSTFFLELFE